MYRHILIATDGSKYALRAAEHGLALAKAENARVTAIVVTPPWSAIGLSEIARGHFEDEFTERMAAYASTCLTPIKQSALERGLACDLRHAIGAAPCEMILDAARSLNCDLIVVGAHGRRGVDALVLGSETTKLLTRSHTPVLVYRE
jgi:nucleotide-binding universal stress UspA family protein